MTSIASITAHKNKKEEVVNLVIKHSQEALIYLIKLQVLSDKMFNEELPVHQLQQMEIKLTELLTLALLEKE
jgi:hypothetical protein